MAGYSKIRISNIVVNKAINADRAVSASYALTASYAMNGGGGGGTPGGSNTQIQFNNNGFFGGVPTLIYSSSLLKATGSFTGSFTGTFTGTSSWATNAVSTSYFSGSISNAVNATSASYAATASLAPNYVLNSATSSFVTNNQTSSFVTTSSFNSFTSSYNTGSFTGSFTGSLQGIAATASFVLSSSYALSSSHARSASYYNDPTNVYTTNRLLIDSAGTQSINWDNRQLITGGQAIFDWGNGLLYNNAGAEVISLDGPLLQDNTNIVSVDWHSRLLYNAAAVPVLNWSGSIPILHGIASSSISSSYASTASYLNTLNQDLTFNGNLILNGTASITYLNVFYESSSIIYSSGSNQFGDATNDTQTLIGRTIVSGSFEVTGSTTSTLGFTGSLKGTADSASYVTTAQTASYVLQAVSSSYALTASYVAGNGSFPYTGSATISGSLSVVGPITSDRGLSEANYIALDKWDLFIIGTPTLATIAVTSGSANGITTLLAPFIVVKDTNITSMSFEVTSGTTTTTASLGIYNSDPISYNPQNLIASCSNIIVSATGTRSGSLNQTLTLTPGLYYTAFQHSGSNTITCRSVPNTNTYNVLGLTTPGNTTIPNYIAGVRPTAGVANFLPTTSSAFSTINRLGTTSLPAIWIRVVS